MQSLRVVSWNVENLAPALGIAAQRARRQPFGRTQLHLFEIHEQLGRPDVLCLQEVRIRAQDTANVALMERALPGYRCFHALCDDPQNGRFRGGRTYGVTTYVRETLPASALPRPAWEREGRLVALRLPLQRLLLVNVYGVNGTARPHFDHELGRISGDRHAYKRRFQANLIECVRSWREGSELLLAGDWNVAPAAIDVWPRLRNELPHALARAMFNDTLLPALDLVDAFRALHPEQRAYTWFNRLAPPGQLDAARVDSVLVSRALLPKVERARIDDESTRRFHSDHAPVRLDLCWV